ncbi:hypothetical protein, partial [Roseisolibacter sp. H3M3-2]|uniref:hypothetical protein n=1 Tax=Roseisolibacter sp. H3M3-2 TaxID=3031323 RepID=UPI0023D98250
MLRVERHGDVVRLEAASRVGRLMGYSASAYLVDRADARGADARPLLVDTLFPRAEAALRALLDALGAAPGRAL